MTETSIKLYAMKRFALFTFIFCASLAVTARSKVHNSNIKTLQVVVNQDFLSLPVMTLGSNDELVIGFDELSHDAHRYLYRLEHCEADWSPSEDIFESDWLAGFNDNPIEEWEKSLNTTVLYTHYQIRIPNDQCQLKMSGNYKLHVIDDDSGEEQLCAEFMVKEDVMTLGLELTTNTDIDTNLSHQQLSMSLSYNGLHVTMPDEQLQTVVMQNGREDNCKRNVRPTFQTGQGLRWEHQHGLIFEAGNEYHKFEVLDLSHPTMGLEYIVWDGQHYQAYPFTCEPRRNYLYDEDADGAFYIRNSENQDNNITCDYVYVHYKLCPARRYENADLVIDGQWTTAPAQDYVMSYNEEEQGYEATVLQKQGYYSYQYLLRDKDFTTHLVPEEGSFYQTENRYQALVYYKGNTDRTWRFVAYRQLFMR